MTFEDLAQVLPVLSLMVFEKYLVLDYAKDLDFTRFMGHDILEPLAMTVAVSLGAFDDLHALVEWNLEVMFDSLHGTALEDVVGIYSYAN